jgi:hypothetical protein
MTMRDARGVPTSATRSASLDGYEVALRRLQGYRGDPIAEIDAVLAEDPTFVQGHIFRASALVMVWEASVLPQIEDGLARLAELGNTANDRERRITAAVRSWADGDWEAMRSRLDACLVDHPRDALALQLAHIADFIHGDREMLRARVARVLPHWSRETPGYGFVLGMYAFGLEECGDYAHAEDTGRFALEIETEDGWAHHAVTHVMEMQARQAEGIAWMESREAQWAQDDNTFAFHNWWHTALFHLDQGHPERALAIYDRHVRPQPSEVQVEMVDAAALLWRLSLQRVDVGNRWDELATAYETTDQGGFYAFNDLHAMMAHVGSRRTASAARLLAAVERAQAEGGVTNARMTREVGLPLVRGLEAFGRQSYAEVVDLLLPLRFRAHAFGGSHAQRDIIHRTLLEAAIRAGHGRLALALANERTALKPHCPFSWQQRQRATTAAPADGVA